VITQKELEEKIVHHWDEIKTLRKVVMIQCVGSRTPERPYCSRLCCSLAVKNALKIKRENPMPRSRSSTGHSNLWLDGTILYGGEKAGDHLYSLRSRFETRSPDRRQSSPFKVRDQILGEEVILKPIWSFWRVRFSPTKTKLWQRC